MDADSARPGGSTFAGVGTSVVILLLVSGAALFTFGLLSGVVIVLAHLFGRWAHRSLSRAQQIAGEVAVVLAWTGAVVGVWFWWSFLWGDYRHPGAGGAIPAPTPLELAAVPVVSAGLGVATLAIATVLRHLREQRP